MTKEQNLFVLEIILDIINLSNIDILINEIIKVNLIKI